MFTNLGDTHDDWMIGGQWTFLPQRSTIRPRILDESLFLRVPAFSEMPCCRLVQLSLDIAVIWPCSGYGEQVGPVLLKKKDFLSLEHETTCACQGGIAAMVSG